MVLRPRIRILPLAQGERILRKSQVIVKINFLLNITFFLFQLLPGQPGRVHPGDDPRASGSGCSGRRSGLRGIPVHPDHQRLQHHLVWQRDQQPVPATDLRGDNVIKLFFSFCLTDALGVVFTALYFLQNLRMRPVS